MSFLFSQPAPGILPANSVDFSEVETIASNTLLGNNTGSDSVILELSKTQATAMLDVMVGDSGAGGTKGLVPAPVAGNAQKVLSGGGTWQYAGHGDGSFGSNNIFLGRGKANTTGTENILISNINSVTTGIRNTIVGANTFNVTTGDGNILIGYNAQLVSGSNTNACSIGGTANGYGTAVRGRAGTFSVAIGAAAGNTGHSYGVAIGDDAVRNAASGSYHVGIGYKALNSVTSGSGSIGIGPFAGRYSTTASELYIGNQEYGNTVLEKANSIIYGVMAVGSTSQTLALNAAVTVKHGLTINEGEKHKSLHAQVGTLNVITATTSDYYIGVDTSSVAKTVNLPAVATAGQGFVLVIKDESGNAATNNITIDANASELIDGALTQVINTNYGSVSLMCSGSAWFIM